uniref:Uncharacterized protein n=1 Tax=Rhizophora mucronata TaxID=61149 RepID=A0A2P2IQW8_RHIMU
MYIQTPCTFDSVLAFFPLFNPKS